MNTTAVQPQSAPADSWDFSQQPERERLDALEMQLASSHLPWAIQGKPLGDFDARMQYRYFNDFRIVHCVCDPFKGSRSVQEISNTDKGYLSLLYVRKGAEHLCIDGKDVLLKHGDMVIWNSQSDISFNVLEPLDKVSILMPETALTSVFPCAADYTGIVVPKAVGVGATLGNHVNTLCNQLNNLCGESLSAMMRPTMEMVAATFSNFSEISPSTMKHIALNRAKQYIINNLHEDDLSPSTIAASLNITPRYLHMLFQEEAVSVGNWIKTRRIERSKDDLLRSLVTKESISGIAFRWGFNDASHFSRTFKQQTGLSPRAFLNQSRDTFLKLR